MESLRCFPKSGIARSCGRSISSFLSNLHTDSIVAAHIFPPTSSGVPFTLHPCQHFFKKFFNPSDLGKMKSQIVLNCLSLMGKDVGLTAVGKACTRPVQTKAKLNSGMES